MTARLLLIEGDLVDHVAHALAAHCQQLRRNGRHVPEALTELLAALPVTARPGQQRPTVLRTAPALDPDAVNLSYRAAAGRLGVSERTVRRMAAAGSLPVQRIGTRALIPASALDAFTTPRKDPA